MQNHMEPSVCVGVKTVEQELSANEQQNICRELYDRMNCDFSLSALDKAVFTDIFVEREKTRDIAMKYNIDSGLISEIKHRVLSKFRDILANEYEIKSYGDFV